MNTKTAFVELKLTQNRVSGPIVFRFTDSRDVELLTHGNDFDLIEEFVRRKVDERLSKKGYEKLIPKLRGKDYDFDIKYEIYTLH